MAITSTKHTQIKPRLSERTDRAFYDIRPGNRAGRFFQPGVHKAPGTGARTGPRKAKLFRMTSHYGPTVVQSFTDHSALCKWGEFFMGSYILWYSSHSGIIFDPQALTARSAFVHKFELCICIHSTDMKGCQKFEMRTLCPWLEQPRNPKSIGFDRLSRTCQVSSHSEQGFSFYRANSQTHTPTYTSGMLILGLGLIGQGLGLSHRGFDFAVCM